MQQTPTPERHTAAAQLIPTMTVAISSLYLTTHSVVVTLIGAGAVSLLACRALWPAQHREQAVGRPGSLTPNTRPAVDPPSALPVHTDPHLGFGSSE